MCPLAPSERSHLLGGGAERCAQYFDGIAARDVKEANNAATTAKDNDCSSSMKKWYIILFGQSIALSLSCANAASSTLENRYGVRVPTFQTGVVYFVLSFHLVYLLFWGRRERIKEGEQRDDCDVPDGNAFFDEVGVSTSCSHRENASNRTMCIVSFCKCNQLETPRASNVQKRRIGDQPTYYNLPFTSFPLHTPWYTYLLLAILDVEANYLAMLSFQHTTLSSSMLLTSLSVLSTVLLRRVVFKSATYDRTRLLGVLLCLIGGCAWLHHEFHRQTNAATAADIDAASFELDGDVSTMEKQPHSSAHAVYGDLLALCAACLYGLNDVCAEYFVKANNDRVEYLGMLGMFGSIISFFIQVPLLERNRLEELVADVMVMDGIMIWQIFLLLLCFVIMLCYFYTSVMKFLSVHDSTILNLSLQTGPLWAVILTTVQDSVVGGSSGGFPPSMFFISLAMIVAGMFLYESNVERGANRKNDDTDQCIECL